MRTINYDKKLWYPWNKLLCDIDLSSAIDSAATDVPASVAGGCLLGFHADKIFYFGVGTGPNTGSYWATLDSKGIHCNADSATVATTASRLASNITLNGTAVNAGSNVNIPAFIAKSLSDMGYVKSADGIIIQWGNVAEGSPSFPIAFPGACLQVVLALSRAICESTGVVDTFSKSSFTWHGQWAGGARPGGNTARYIAIGY